MNDDNVIEITNENMKLIADSKDNIALSPNYDIDKVYIWGYELCEGAEWNDFLEVVNKLGKENKKLKQQLESQPIEIIKTIKNFCEIKYCDKEVSLNQVKDFLDDILKEYQKDKN